jgi:DNA-binding MarR family transcriptional regulator
LLRTADVVRRSIAEIVEPHGITLQQYNVLRILRGSGAEGLPTLEIAERMIEEAPGITRLIDRLEAKKLVTRKRCTTDRRIVWCRITDAGLALLADLDGPIREADRVSLAALSDRETTQLITLLDKTRKGLSVALQERRSEVDVTDTRRIG